jgi:myosin heavy subunit
MGYKGAPIVHLMMGSESACEGYLVGEAHQGLKYMFQMMNEARLGIGMNATAIATAAFHASLDYAKVRPQGRNITDREPNRPQVPIIQHADVKRMLLVQKSITEGSLALLIFCGLLGDQVSQEIDPIKKGELEAQNELLLLEQTDKNEEIQNLKEELEAIKTVKEEGEVGRLRLREEYTTLQEELEAIKTVKEEGEEGRLRLREEYTTLQKELEKIKQEKADLQINYDALVKEKDEIVAKYNDLLRENATLKDEITQLKTKNQELETKNQELEEKLKYIGNDCYGKDAEIANLRSELTEELRKNKETLDKLIQLEKDIYDKDVKHVEELEKVRVEKVTALAEAARKHAAVMKDTAEKLALWISSPVIPLPFDTGPFAPVVQTIKTLIQTKNDEIKRLSVQQDPVKAKAEATSRHCYMLFFAAHTMSVHFPTYIEPQMNAEKIRISEYIQKMLYGEVPNVKGLLREDLIAKDKTTLLPERKLLDVLIKLLNSMENYYDSKETSEKEQSSLDSEKEILNLIEEKVKKVLKEKVLGIQEFQQETAKYMDVRLGKNGGHIERVYYYRKDGKSIIGTLGDDDKLIMTIITIYTTSNTKECRNKSETIWSKSKFIKVWICIIDNI